MDSVSIGNLNLHSRSLLHLPVVVVVVDVLVIVIRRCRRRRQSTDQTMDESFCYLILIRPHRSLIITVHLRAFQIEI